MQTVGFSTSILAHGAFGLLLFSLIRLAPGAPPAVIIDLSILAAQPATPAPQAAVATIVPAAPPIARQEVVQPQPPKKVVKTKVAPVSEVVQHPSPATVTEVKQEAIPPASEATEKNSFAAQPTMAREEGGAPTATVANGNSNTSTVAKLWIKENFNFIKEAIRKNMTYPTLARKNGWQGKVLVSFVICLDGLVEDIRIAKSSGVALLDKNAVDTIKQIAPFPNPPVRATIIVPINYTLD